MKINLRDLNKDETIDFAKSIGEPKYRGIQIFEWIQRGITSFDDMTNISKALRTKLSNLALINTLKIIDKKSSKLDDTKKYLFELKDGNSIESVLMKYKYGYSLCVSSQVGCRMGCKFCATAISGLVRNLAPSEILSQILEIQNDKNIKIGHIVLMGMGEPLDNYENVSKFLKIIHDESGLNISYRNITVSTCGVANKILKFARDFSAVNLAISLHFANNEARSNMMPINKKYDITTLLDTCKKYIDITNRRITFEYTLVKDKNDSIEDMNLLIKKLSNLNCHINLIPLNEVKETGFLQTSKKRANELAAYLKDCGINATVRRELGADIDGACGQLRLKNKI